MNIAMQRGSATYIWARQSQSIKPPRSWCTAQLLHTTSAKMMHWKYTMVEPTCTSKQESNKQHNQQLHSTTKLDVTKHVMNTCQYIRVGCFSAKNTVFTKNAPLWIQIFPSRGMVNLANIKEFPLLFDIAVVRMVRIFFWKIAFWIDFSQCWFLISGLITSIGICTLNQYATHLSIQLVSGMYWFMHVCMCMVSCIFFCFHDLHVHAHVLHTVVVHVCVQLDCFNSQSLWGMHPNT